MGSANKFSGGNCCCGAGVATLTLTVKACGVILPSQSITLTQGATSVTATTNGSGIATFSLPATGTWTWVANSPPTGYVTTGGSITGIVAGSNSRTISLNPDRTGGYFCDGCGNPVTSLTLTWRLFGGSASGIVIGTPVVSVLTWRSVDGTIRTPWVSEGGGWWVRFYYAEGDNSPGFGGSEEKFTGGAAPADTPAPGPNAAWTVFSGACSPYSWAVSNGSGGAAFNGTQTH